jgi:isorenieratene synthase
MPALRHPLWLPSASGRSRVPQPTTVVVVGGGIAGIAAATVLAERGVTVTLLEEKSFLGGRAGAWTDRLSSGESFEMERGFHAFFRQYYNLQALLRRIDPQLGFLQALDDYPILGPAGQMQTFSGLPRQTPWNVMMLALRSPALKFGDLRHVDARRALEMLSFDMDGTYGRHDFGTAGEYLDSLRFPPDARRLLFDVFAHSFFNPEEEMSAAELLMMFHFYFTGNPEGLVFDVAKAPFSTAIWDPMRSYLEKLGVSIQLRERVTELRRANEVNWQVVSEAQTLSADGVVLAVTVPALQNIVRDSADLTDIGWRESIEKLELTHPFAVWRLWLDRPTRSDRAPFVGTTGLGPLDNISVYNFFEDESRAWAARTGGCVVELHAYAVDPRFDEPTLRRDLLQGLHTLYPEIAEARILEERFFVHQDCPAFRPGSWAQRPSVSTPLPEVVLAGDFVRLPIPSALMERAAASGFLAANLLLARQGVGPVPIESVPRRGILARWSATKNSGSSA